MATAQVRGGLLNTFDDEPNLANALCRMLDTIPDEAPIFQALITYVVKLKSSGGISLPDHGSKKRKIGGADTPTQNVEGSVLFSYPDTSFSVPVRKKLRLEGLNSGIRGVDASGNMEASMAWDAIDYVFCLPVPERAKPQSNFVAIPRHDAGLEALVWTAPEPNPKLPETTHLTPQQMAKTIDSQLGNYGLEVIFPSEDEFVSQLGGKTGAGPAFGTRTHRGSKEGHLFFLSPGILFAFKKPLLFLPFSSITSISYTSILQRTFNIVVVAQEPNSSTETEIEFSMLDQADFPGIDAYVKRHGLNDASLADKRRAQIYNVNKPKGTQADTIVEGTPGQNGTESELQKAEMQLQDEEDEDEEDYVDEGYDDDEGSSEDEEYGEGEEGEGEYDEEEEEEYDEEAGGYEDEEEDAAVENE